jgi:hypothetical protein
LGTSFPTIHILWARVATSFPTVLARVVVGYTAKTGTTSLPSRTPCSNLMTERKCAHVARRRCAEDALATYWTSVNDIFPTSIFCWSMTAIEEIPRDVIVSSAVITRASALIEMTFVEPMPNSPI